MKRGIAVLVLVMLAALGGYSQGWEASVPPALDKLTEKYYKPSILVAFGTFTFAETDIASPFSRWLEGDLAAAVAKSSRVQLFNKAAAAAMDPAFRKIYGDFFATNSVDALLSGRYYDEGKAVRVHTELTGLSDGVLIGTEDFIIPVSSIPRDISIGPTKEALSAANNLGGIVSAREAADFKVSVSTERGASAVYREGEDMVVLVTASKDAWIKVYHIDVDGKVQLIYPNRFGGEGRIRAGQAVKIPEGGDPFKFKMTPPYGTEFIKVVASTGAFAKNEEDFTELGADARGVISRGLAVLGAGTAEKAESLASYVITK